MTRKSSLSCPIQRLMILLFPKNQWQIRADGQRFRPLINRRRTQTYADSIFSLLDLSKEKLHALGANSFISSIKEWVAIIVSTKEPILKVGVFNREAIEGFCPVGSTGQKNLKSASVCGRLRLKKNQMIKDNLRIL